MYLTTTDKVVSVIKLCLSDQVVSQ